MAPLSGTGSSYNNSFTGGKAHGNIVIGRYDCSWSTLDYCHAGLWDGTQVSGTSWESVRYWQTTNRSVIEMLPLI